jgi:hypothetical protein
MIDVAAPARTSGAPTRSAALPLIELGVAVEQLVGPLSGAPSIASGSDPCIVGGS